jgi:hypothetical protein
VIFPSFPITNAARCAEPGESGLNAPYDFAIALSESERRSKLNSNFSANFRLASTLSKLAPRMVASIFEKSRIRSRNPQPSFVQPGVSALG